MSTAWVLLRPVAGWVYLTLWNLNKINGCRINKQEFQEEMASCLYSNGGAVRRSRSRSRSNEGLLHPQDQEVKAGRKKQY